MAKAKSAEAKTVKKGAVKASAKKTVVDRKAALRAEIDELVKQYNDAAEFREFKFMKELDGQIADKVGEYTLECESACFAAIGNTENPMLEAAKTLTFETIKVRDAKLESGGTERVVESASKRIDPFRLHQKVKGGIGHDKLWWSKVERLNMLLTAATAIELKAVNESGDKLDLAKIRDTAMMRDETKKIALKNEDDPTNDEVILADLQDVIDAMLGEGYEAEQRMVSFLRSVHARAGRDGVSVVCSTHRNMRQYMLSICHFAVTGDDVVLNYKVAKK